VALDPLTLEIDQAATEERRQHRPSIALLFDRGPTFAPAEAEWRAKRALS
jgi:hypothetical protein